jgi:hypothetical protein
MFTASPARRPLIATAMIVASLLGTAAGAVAATTAAMTVSQAAATATHSAHVLAAANPDDTPWG